MIIKRVWQLTLLLALPKIEIAVGGTNEAATITGGISSFFGDDATKFEALCDAFVEDFGLKVCEMEGGWRRKGKKGFEDEKAFEDVLQTLLRKGGGESEKTDEDLERGRKNYHLRDEDKVLEELPICNITLGSDEDYGTKRMGVKKTIRLLIADVGFDKHKYRITREALNNFNYCTQDSIHFELETMIMETNVDDKNWMDATYLVMQEAKKRGIDFTHNEYDHELSNNDQLLFNKEAVMNMIIIPDSAVFPSKQVYGFALVNSGLSVIKAKEAGEGKSIIHEIGYNLGLRHSGTSEGEEYGDDLCIMGDSKDNDVCFNGAKSEFLGLYAEKTGYVDDMGSGCYTKIDLVDVSDHLFNGTNIEEKHGDYYVNFRFEDDSGTFYMLMYYRDEDIVTLTVEHDRVERENDANDWYTFSGTSTRAFDLEKDQSNVYDGFFFKRCPSSDGRATVLFSTNEDEVNNC